MLTNHRKLLSEQDSSQNSTCSDCGPTCPYKCSYPEIFWPPQPPPLPPHTTTNTTHISPYVVIIVALIGSAFLFISYYLIMVRCGTRFRQPPTAQVYGESEELSDDDRGFEVDHPIWYITTIGLQPSIINSISVIKFKKDDNLIEGTDCSVCLNEFQDDETLRLLPKCNHAFHIPCIDTWLRSHTNCPLCRAGILLNTLSTVLSPNDRNDEARSNQDTHIGNLQIHSEGDGSRIRENEILEEIEDSKTEYESVMAARRSVSLDSVAVSEIIRGELEGGSGNSSMDFHSSDRGGDLRT